MKILKFILLLIKQFAFQIAIVALFIFGIYWICWGDERTVEARVERIETIRETNSNDDGKVSSRTYYLIITNKGTFRVSIDGFMANATCLGQLHEGEEAIIEVRGHSAPFLGIYSNVVGVKEKKKL